MLTLPTDVDPSRTDASTDPPPVIPEPDPTHTPVIPEPDPTQTPVIPEPDPTHTPVVPDPLPEPPSPAEPPTEPATEPLVDPPVVPTASTERRRAASASLAETLAAALDGDAGDGYHRRALAAAADVEPMDRADAHAALALVHDLHLAPFETQGPRLGWQHHPAVAALKQRLETDLLADVDRASAAAARALRQLVGAGDPPPEGTDAVAEVRAIAALDQVPPVYDWLADEADADEVVRFLALEGGPDGTFDDLVAIAQVGLGGAPKLELATNYWDEMGRGRHEDVHTALHHRMAAALSLGEASATAPPIDRATSAVLAERSALVATLVTNRALQPEQLGALGLIELQAGPRCRRVVAALRRTGAPDDALPFYEEHAVADPRHGRDWLDHVVAPLADDPRWAPGIVRGARWRWWVNHRFFTTVGRLVGATERT